MVSFAYSAPEIRVNVLFLRDTASLYAADDREGPPEAFPAPSTEHAAGVDLRADLQDELTVEPGARVSIPTGIAIEPLVSGIAGIVYSRSGLGAKQGLTVAQGVGVIDPDYRGELTVWLLNTSGNPITVHRGDRIAQLIFQPFRRPRFTRVDRLGDTLRGSGGFGHTGMR